MIGVLGTAAVAAMMGLASAELPPVHVTGSKFFYENGTQFFMKGIAYQQEVTQATIKSASGSGAQKFLDPLADTKSCERDVPLLQQLGTNTIRVYAIDPEADQDTCLQLLDEAGIYVIYDLSQPGESINRDSPAWDDVLYARYTAVVDKTAKYSNTLGYFAGNEVTNNVTNTNASPFVKAAVRDMKAYIKQKGYRKIPVGYATNDDAEIRDKLADYFNCGEASDSIDFWGYNIYSWCGESSFEKSGFDVRTEEFADYNVPVFFAEYGCNEVQPRPFTEVEAIYGEQMTPVWSGGIVYMYFQEANDYGLVKVSSDGEAETNDDFDNLKDQMENVNPSAIEESDYKPTNTAARACPAVGSDWKASENLPPTPDQALCSCMVKSLECIVKPGVNETEYGDMFGFACDALGEGGCAGISVDGENGVYGSFSVCSASEKMSWALNAYFQSQKSTNPGACNFEGRAKAQTATSDSNCKQRIDDAGGPSGTAASSSNSSKKSGAASGTISAPSFSMIFVNIGIALVVAFTGGVGLVVM